MNFCTSPLHLMYFPTITIHTPPPITTHAFYPSLHIPSPSHLPDLLPSRPVPFPITTNTFPHHLLNLPPLLPIPSTHYQTYPPPITSHIFPPSPHILSPRHPPNLAPLYLPHLSHITTHTLPHHLTYPPRSHLMYCPTSPHVFSPQYLMYLPYTCSWQ